MVTVKITSSIDVPQLDAAALKKLAGSVCRRFGLKDAAVGIAVIDDRGMRLLNARFLGREATTDCLSFDLTGGPAGEKDPRGARSIDIAVNARMAARRARRRGHSAAAELALYVVHGLLHQLGFNDDTPGAAKKMHAEEDEILRLGGYGFVYNRKRGSDARCGL
jgi:probable rRNA maturation factor